jgi:hypothetical protein
MKNKRFFMMLPILAVIICANAQETQQPFAPIGAKWTYGIDPGYWGVTAEYPRYFEVMGDTILKGKTCSVIKQSGYGGIDYHYFFQTGQKIYCLNKTDSTFYLIYDFSLNVGDSWKVPHPNPDHYYDTEGYFDTLIYNVTDVNYVEYNGVTLKQLKITPTYQYDCYAGYSFGFNITERFGGSRYIFQFRFGCDDMNVPANRCYSDSEINVQFRNIACDSVIYINHVNIDNAEQNKEITYFNDKIELSQNLFNQTDKVLIYNDIGQCILYAKPDSSRIISVSSLQSGVYIVAIISENQNITKKMKFIKK